MTASHTDGAILGPTKNPMHKIPDWGQWPHEENTGIFNNVLIPFSTSASTS